MCLTELVAGQIATLPDYLNGGSVELTNTRLLILATQMMPKSAHS